MNQGFEVHKALGEDTRYAIYLHLSQAGCSLTVQDLTKALGLHPNTVRPHLDRLREAGLVVVDTDPRGGVGRPQHRFSVVPTSPRDASGAAPVALMGTLLACLAERLGADDAQAYAVGREHGRVAFLSRGVSADPLQSLVEELDDNGFAPLVERTCDDGAVIAITHCPLRPLVNEHAELVCALHRGIVEGFVDTSGTLDVDEFRTLTTSGTCQVAVSAR